ncbi:TatD family hydrolase [Bdellovibrio sp. NC01]|uniref:TatD family hydrolase n=1 Tax=Bdellovibrio sp. NC01 TaxID=2220073 RepID=UPI00115AABAB|nr:TatD family hydrolase [Bdellovibrio sp. NC01]QDK38241.1 TatD family deoxyribonuclease [Bdellovibrio sp. NC01]
MVAFGSWVDAHGHLADARWDGQQDQIIEEARQKGIHFFMQGGVGPEDWEKQKALKARYPKHIGLCFGLHPYWVVDHDEEACEQALDLLATQLPQAKGLGEAGLDFRPHIMKDSQDRQITVFEAQLELAQLAHKPMVLHLVQAHDFALRIMDLFGLPEQKGMVHSFNGSAAKAQDFLNRGLYLSVGGPVARPDNQKLHQAVREIPLEFLLIESDSPDQAPPLYQGRLNPPESIWEVAKTIGELKSLDPLEILDITTGNFHRLFGDT